MKILVLLICYGTGKTTPALARLKGIHAALRDGHEREYLVVDNAMTPGYRQQLDPQTLLIGGDNTHREFSGTDRGLAFVGPRLAEFGLVHLTTETFETDYQHYLGLLTPKILTWVLEKKACVGHIDAYPREVTLFGVRSRAWIRSCFLLAPAAAIRALGSLVTADGSGTFFTDDPRRPFHPAAPIDQLYQQYLWQWLTGSGGAAAEINCHRDPFAVTAETFDRFKAKAVAVVNEHGLSVRLRTAGCPTVDLEWLYDMFLTHAADTIAPQTPMAEMLRYTGERRVRLGITPP
jgi:hypothetical protein